MRAMPLVILFLATMPIFSQHRGGFAGAGMPVARPGSPTHPAGFAVAGRTNRGFYPGRPFVGSGFGSYGRRFGYGPGYIWPYYPAWDYGSAMPLFYGDEFSGAYPPDNAIALGPGYVMPGPGAIAVPARVASSVLHEYHFAEPAEGRAGGKVTFTIVLKDGSTRSAVASWISAGKLHYLDSKAQQQVLSPELIDRDATEQVNEAKNLKMELPPG